MGMFPALLSAGAAGIEWKGGGSVNPMYCVFKVDWQVPWNGPYLYSPWGLWELPDKGVKHREAINRK